MAAGMINTKAIQLQFLLNHASSRARLRTNTNTIDKSPHGNIRKEEGLVDGAMFRVFIKEKDKNNLLMIAYFYYTYLHPLFAKSAKLKPNLKLIIDHENCYR